LLLSPVLALQANPELFDIPKKHEECLVIFLVLVSTDLAQQEGAKSNFSFLNS
jgi:hypothetical protein